jgi:hypothetical protein
MFIFIDGHGFDQPPCTRRAGRLGFTVHGSGFNFIGFGVQGSGNKKQGQLSIAVFIYFENRASGFQKP